MHTHLIPAVLCITPGNAVIELSLRLLYSVCEQTKASAPKLSPLLCLTGAHFAVPVMPLEMNHHIFSAASDYIVTVVTTVLLII